MTAKPNIAPAVLNLSETIKAVAVDVEKRHAKTLKTLRQETAAYEARGRALARATAERIEDTLMEAWIRGEVPPEAIWSSPNPETLEQRRTRAEQMNANVMDYKLERQAAPLLVEVLEGIADGIEANILPGAVELDKQAKAFGEAGTVAPRVMESIIRHRQDAQFFRTKSAFSLGRLFDYLNEE